MFRSLSSYQIRLLVFLSVAGFFDGYDLFALSQVLPHLRAEIGLSKAMAGTMISVISAGAMGSYFLVRLADTWGRRRLLMITIIGYTLATFVTGLTSSALSFTAVQFVARVFLTAEWTMSMIYVAEEFPAAARGRLLVLMQCANALGVIACALLTPVLMQTSFGWRTIYLVSLVPLLILMVARRNLRETQRFVDLQKSDRKSSMRAGANSFVGIFHSPYRKRLLQMSLVWALMFMATNVAIVFWKDFALHEAGLLPREAAMTLSLAALLSLPLALASGRLLDSMGRIPGGFLIFSLGALGMAGSFTFHGRSLLTLSLTFSCFGLLAMPAVLNALTTELFPTQLRATASAWSSTLLGRTGFVAAPLLVGLLAEYVGGYGPAVALFAIFPLLSIILVSYCFPETKGKELEESSRL